MAIDTTGHDAEVAVRLDEERAESSRRAALLARPAVDRLAVLITKLQEIHRMLDGPDDPAAVAVIEAMFPGITPEMMAQEREDLVRSCINDALDATGFGGLR